MVSWDLSLRSICFEISQDIISSPLSMRKKSLDATISCTSLESLGHGSNVGDDDDDVGMEENDNGASNPNLPILASGANLTAHTTNFIVEAKEKLQAHSQHMSRAFPNKILSETELSVVSTMSKHFTNRPGNNSMGGKKDTCQHDTLVSPMVRKQATKTAWRSPKADSHRLSSFISSTTSNSNASSPGNLRHQVDVPLHSKSSPDVKKPSHKPSRVSQISLSYEDTTKEKKITATQYSQRKPKPVGFSSLPLPRKTNSKTHPSSTTSSIKPFNNKGQCVYAYIQLK